MAMLCYAVLVCHAISWHAMTRCATLCHAVLRYTTLCCAVLCYAVHGLYEVMKHNCCNLQPLFVMQNLASRKPQDAWSL